LNFTALQVGLSVSAFLSLLFITLGIPSLSGRHTTGRLSRSEALYQKYLNELFISTVNARQITTLVWLASLFTALFLYFYSGSLIVASAAIGLLFTPEYIFAWMKHKRLEKFERVLPMVMDQMSNSARAGLSLSQILEDAALNTPQPAAQEFGLIVQDYQLGASLEEALESARIRLDSPLFNLLATSLIVNRTQGGNLPEALQSMSTAFKEIARLEQKLITASAEGRKAVRLISGMPIFIFVMVSLMQPDMVTLLTSTFLGIVILIIAVLFYAIGLWWLVKVLKIEV